MSTSIAPTTAPEGKSDARFATTAAWAQAETSTPQLAAEVSNNVQKAQVSAQQAATEAPFKHKESAVEDLEKNLSEKTNDAAAEGHSDVQSAKDTSLAYLDQAKELAKDVIASAQTYLNGSHNDTTVSGNGPSTTEKLTNAASAALTTGKEYLSSAQQTVQPHINAAVAAAQPHIERAKDAVAGSINSSSNSSEPIAPTTAPLESGPHVVSGPYAPTSNKNVQIGEVA